jgi:hypothetical protein
VRALALAAAACLAFVAAGADARHGDDRLCVSGTAIGCDDHDPCTVDRCVGFSCVHEPATGPACDDHDACTEDDRCDAGHCVGTPVVCRDDGFSCTDETCVAGRCTAVPVDARCVPTDACTAAICAPSARDHDAAGCSPGPARRDGAECAEDGDACTADVCAGGRCTHPPAPVDRASCAAVQDAFARARALRGLAVDVLATSGDGVPAAVTARLAAIRDAFDAAARALAGKNAEAAATASGGLAETLVIQRARRALGILRTIRPEVSALARNVRQPAVRAQVGGEVAGNLGRGVRALARGLRALGAELRGLVAKRGSFVR